MKWVDYREKLGIGFNDEQKFKMLSNMMQNFVDNVVGNEYSESAYFDYCMMTGETYLDYNRPYQHLSSDIGHCKIMTEILSKFIAFYNTYKVVYNQYSYRTTSKKEVLDFIKNSLNNLNVEYEILEDADGVFIFPKGAKELDDALVSEPLSWLKNYPSSHAAFIKSLKEYSSVTEKNASDVADLFRKALETFFQEFFKSTKTLENLKSEYGAYMKSKGVPAEISNNLEVLQQSYTNFMNGYAKHHDKTSINVLEYLLYQTGNIIRLLITLEGVWDNEW